MDDKKITRASHALSALLRHGAHEAKLAMDAAGWAAIDDVLRAAHLDRATLDTVVRENNKSRLEVRGERIRACQGHSLKNMPVTLEALEDSWAVDPRDDRQHEREPELRQHQDHADPDQLEPTRERREGGRHARQPKRLHTSPGRGRAAWLNISTGRGRCGAPLQVRYAGAWTRGRGTGSRRSCGGGFASARCSRS